MDRLDGYETKKILKIGQRIEINQIGFIDQNDEESTSEIYMSRIEDIKGSEVYLALPMDSMLRPIIPQADDIIRGTIADRDHLYVFKAKYEKIAKINIPVWKIIISSTVYKKQNREFVRVKVEIPLKISITDADGSIQHSFSTHTVDLSGNGISFLSSQKLAKGVTLTVETTPIISVGRIHTFVEVKQCRNLKNINKYFIGASFSNLAKLIQNKLIKYLFDKQRELIQKGIITK